MVQPKKISICLIGLVLLFTLLNVALVIFDADSLLIVISIAVTMFYMLVVLRSVRTISSAVFIQMNGLSQNPSKVASILLGGSIEKIQNEVSFTCTQIDIAITQCIRNISAVEEMCGDAKKNIYQLIDEAKYINILIFSDEGIGHFRSDLDMRCNRIYNLGQDGIDTITKIETTIKSLSEIDDDYGDASENLGKLYNKSNVMICGNDIDEPQIDCSTQLKYKHADYAGPEKETRNQKVELGRYLSKLTSVSNAMQAMSINLIGLEKIHEHSQAILLCLHELSVAIRKSSHNYFSNIDNIRNRLCDMQTSVCQENLCTDLSANSVVSGLHKLKAQISELVSDRPK